MLLAVEPFSLGKVGKETRRPPAWSSWLTPCTTRKRKTKAKDGAKAVATVARPRRGGTRREQRAVVAVRHEAREAKRRGREPEDAGMEYCVWSKPSPRS